MKFKGPKVIHSKTRRALTPLVIATIFITLPLAGSANPCHISMEGATPLMPRQAVRQIWLDRGFVETQPDIGKSDDGLYFSSNPDKLPDAKITLRWNTNGNSVLMAASYVATTKTAPWRFAPLIKARMAAFCPGISETTVTPHLVCSLRGENNVRIAATPEKPQQQGSCTYSFAAKIPKASESLSYNRENNP